MINHLIIIFFGVIKMGCVQGREADKSLSESVSQKTDECSCSVKKTCVCEKPKSELVEVCDDIEKICEECGKIIAVAALI